MFAIDDATSLVSRVTFRAAEDAAGYFSMLSQTALRHVLPIALYSYLHYIFIFYKNRPPTLSEQLSVKPSFAQVFRALYELFIRCFRARSPHANFLFYLLFFSLHFLLFIYLRLSEAFTLADAHVVLASYLPRHYRRFAVPAADPEPAWRPLPPGARSSRYCASITPV